MTGPKKVNTPERTGRWAPPVLRGTRRRTWRGSSWTGIPVDPAGRSRRICGPRRDARFPT